MMRLTMFRVNGTDFEDIEVLNLGEPTPAGEDDTLCTLRWPTGMTFTAQIRDMSLENMSLLTNIPLVDLSIMFEPHLVRGDQ